MMITFDERNSDLTRQLEAILFHSPTIPMSDEWSRSPCYITLVTEEEAEAGKFPTGLIMKGYLNFKTAKEAAQLANLPKPPKASVVEDEYEDEPGILSVLRHIVPVYEEGLSRGLTLEEMETAAETRAFIERFGPNNRAQVVVKVHDDKYDEVNIEALEDLQTRYPESIRIHCSYPEGGLERREDGYYVRCWIWRDQVWCKEHKTRCSGWEWRADLLMFREEHPEGHTIWCRMGQTCGSRPDHD